MYTFKCCQTTDNFTENFASGGASRCFLQGAEFEVTPLAPRGVTLGGTGVRTPRSDPPTFLERGTGPLTFCDHLVPKYYKSRAAQLWRAADAYTGINSDCHEYICKYVNQRPYWTV